MIPWLQMFSQVAPERGLKKMTKSEKKRRKAQVAAAAVNLDGKCTITTMLQKGCVSGVADFLANNPESIKQVQFCSVLKSVIWNGNVDMVRLVAGLIQWQIACGFKPCKCEPCCFTNIRGPNMRTPLRMAEKLARANKYSKRAATIVSILSFRAGRQVDTELVTMPAMQTVEKSRNDAKRKTLFMLWALKIWNRTDMNTPRIDRFVFAKIARMIFAEYQKAAVA